MALGARLKQLLDKKNITVKDFSRQIGVAPTTLYSFIKRDSDTGKIDLITKIAHGLDMEVNDFLSMPDVSIRVNITPEHRQQLEIENKFSKGEPLTKEENTILENYLKEHPITEMCDTFRKMTENLVGIMNTLNPNGQAKALEQLEMLTKIPEYQRTKSDQEDGNADEQPDK